MKRVEFATEARIVRRYLVDVADDVKEADVFFELDKFVSNAYAVDIDEKDEEYVRGTYKEVE